MNTSPNVVVLGAGSLIAPWLVKRLGQMGLNGQYHGRKQIHIDRADTFVWRTLDLNAPVNFNPESIVISLLPMELLPPILPQLQGCRHLIAFSTTSIFSKRNSPNPKERELVKQIMAAEKKVIQASTAQKIPWTILRPTLIYDGQNDQNITAMAKFIQRWWVLPVAGPAKGLRQPVHADDVAAAVAAAIENHSSYDRCFNLGGGEILTYRRMVQRIFQAMEKPPRILPLPVKLILAICRMLRFLTRKGPNPAIFIRMNQDLVYNFTDARKHLNFNPRPFRPDFHMG